MGIDIGNRAKKMKILQEYLNYVLKSKKYSAVSVYLTHIQGPNYTKMLYWLVFYLHDFLFELSV